MFIRRSLSLICALALIATIGLDAQAQAAPRNFFGVASTLYPTAAQLQRASGGGVSTVRVVFSWPSIQPSPGVLDWQKTDSLVADSARAGTSLLPVLFGTPQWASSANPYTPASPPIYTAQSRAAWSTFVRALAERYGGDGIFWTLHPELPRLPVESWQVWNEVNLPAFWGGRPNARRYASLLELTGQALHAADSSAKVVMAGLLPYKSIVAGSVAGPEFLQRLYRVKGFRKLFDVAAVHPYALRPRAVLGLIRDMRMVLDSHNSRKVPIWATEFGWTTGGSDFGASPFRSTLAQQARRVNKTYRLMRRHAKGLGLKRAFYFSLEDSALSSSWQARMGLFGVDGQPKPAWYAYARLAGGQP